MYEHTPKNDERRSIPLPVFVVDALKAARRVRPFQTWIAEWPDVPGEPVHVDCVSAYFRTLAARCGAPTGLHSLRRFLLTKLARHARSTRRGPDPRTQVDRGVEKAFHRRARRPGDCCDEQRICRGGPAAPTRWGSGLAPGSRHNRDQAELASSSGGLRADFGPYPEAGLAGISGLSPHAKKRGIPPAHHGDTAPTALTIHRMGPSCGQAPQLPRPGVVHPAGETFRS